ncbi:MAG: hypothetical protein JHD16_16645 [Solirubrobacteraceae bacterium]|nr:hypothetical protein [Solirubrobacteraceae bacterium]
MYLFLKTRMARATAASLAGLMLAGSFGPAATAVAAPVIDRNQPAPTPNADPDPFYTPPAVLPAGDPGDIIRARPAKAGPPTARALANAWQVMYLSTNAVGERNTVTGTVLVPKGVNPANAPVVSFAPGTTGPAFRCTVSRFINSGSFYEQAAVNEMLKAGYAVAVTDYDGYYENPETSYIVGAAMGPAVLDMARAASRLPEAGLSATPRVLLRGYSQGGAAVMWAGQLEPTYAPELNLLGVAGGGVPSNLASVALGLEGKAAFGFEIAAVIGLDNAYDELDLENYLFPEAKTVFANSEANDCTIELLTGYEGKLSEDYTEPSPFGDAKWLARVGQNTLGKTPINAPVLQYHATNDQIVPFGQARSLRNNYCALGMQVDWKLFDTGHITTVARGNADAMKFIGDRLSGAPVTSNC